TSLGTNYGAANEHRALNYLILRYPAIYTRTAEDFGRNFTLASIDVAPSRLSGDLRQIVDVILRFTNRATGVVERYLVRVDVTGEFPFVLTGLTPYFTR